VKKLEILGEATKNIPKAVSDNCQYIVDKKSCHDIVDNRPHLTPS
jgi:uncharacterized protein with HEPN domain